MSNNKTDRKLNLSAETVRVLSSSPEKQQLITAEGNGSKENGCIGPNCQKNSDDAETAGLPAEVKIAKNSPKR